jgi:hypothetical protein
MNPSQINDLKTSAYSTSGTEAVKLLRSLLIQKVFQSNLCAQEAYEYAVPPMASYYFRYSSHNSEACYSSPSYIIPFSEDTLLSLCVNMTDKVSF